MTDSSGEETFSHPALNNIAFVIVRPVYLGNIGAVARAMKNFGLENLRLVSPPKNYKDAEARKMAVGAFDILKQSTVFDSLDEALKDVSMAIGTTAGTQRKLVLEPISAVSPQIIEAARENKVAVVFGDERDGLRQDDLNRCHHIVTIPTAPSLASLNLAQAVCIFGYELSMQIRLSNRDENRSTKIDSELPATTVEKKLSTGEEDDDLIHLFGQLSDSIKFSRTYNRQLVNTEFRQLWQRVHPTKREADLLKGILIRLNQHLGKEEKH